MSLTDEELRRTGDELQANLMLSGLTNGQVESDLDFTPEQLHGCLAGVDGVDPVDVWQLRDFLEQAVTDAGGQPAAFTVLTAVSRVRAQGWFRLRDAPRHQF